MKELRKLSDNMYVYDFDKYADRPNLYYIKGKDYSIAIDAGNSPAHCKEFYDAINRAGFNLPLYTIISHWHWDHTFGLSTIWAYSISSAETRKQLDKVMKWKWTLEDMKQREKTGEDISFCTENIIREYSDLSSIKVVNTDTGIDEKVTMDLGNMFVDLIPMPSTHGNDSLFVYIPSEEALIVQDADCEDFYNGAVYDQETLKKMIEFFKSLDYKYHYLGHADVESKEFALNRLKAELK